MEAYSCVDSQTSVVGNCVEDQRIADTYQNNRDNEGNYQVDNYEMKEIILC